MEIGYVAPVAAKQELMLKMIWVIWFSPAINCNKKNRYNKIWGELIHIAHMTHKP
jgi:hypothetical protein